jgi:hypothetical protein
MHSLFHVSQLSDDVPGLDSLPVKPCFQSSPVHKTRADRWDG